MAEAVYFLCTVTSILCAVLLLRHYRDARTRLLLWSSVAFTGLAVNNLLLFIDFFVPTIDLGLARNLSALAGMGALVVGLVWHSGAPRS